ncbi:MAG: serine protease [Kofleriaceae bacterium]
MRFTLFVLGIGLVGCVAADDTRATSQDIIGGEMANPADFPSVVALEDTPGNWFCTGTLITPEWVLTAAHCTDGASAATLHIKFGDPDVNTAAGGIAVAVAEIHSHPDFDYDAWDNDIALVKLAAPSDRTPTPINRDQVATDTDVLDVGYGVADNNDNGAGLLRKVAKVTADCGGAGDAGITNTNLVCMDASDGRGSCFGDSGGPTFATINSAKVVVGVTSGGTGDACGAGWDLYTSVHGELDFIDGVLGGLTPPDPDPTDPDPTPDPDPTDPDPEDGGGDDGGSSGGCNAGGSAGLALAFAAGLLRRRRRR